MTGSPAGTMALFLQLVITRPHKPEDIIISTPSTSIHRPRFPSRNSKATAKLIVFILLNHFPSFLLPWNFLPRTKDNHYLRLRRSIVTRFVFQKGEVELELRLQERNWLWTVELILLLISIR